MRQDGTHEPLGSHPDTHDNNLLNKKYHDLIASEKLEHIAPI